MAKIDRVEDLPEWFNLEKYRACESFGAVEWLEQLDRRFWLFAGHPDFSAAKPNTEFADLPRFQLDLWCAMTSQAALIVRESPVASEVADNMRRALASPEGMPVKAVTVATLAMQRHRDGIAASEGDCHPRMVRRWEVIGDPCHPFDAYADVAGMPITLDFYGTGRPHCAVVQVDMAATDAVLVAAFASWLKQARDEQRMLGAIVEAGSAYDRWTRYGLPPDAASKRERLAYAKWHGYGLLPYLDLLIWAMETGNQIPHHVMAQAVGYRRGGDSFRKTVPKLADELMRSLAELEALAAIEAASEKLGA